VKEDTLWNCVFKPRNEVDRIFHSHLLLMAITWVLEKRARTTGPNPEKVTMTERTCLPLESDIRKMQLVLQFKIRNLRKNSHPRYRRDLIYRSVLLLNG
jgi:hypothetical protein